MGISEVFFSLLRAAIIDTPVDFNCSSEEHKELYLLSKRHDVAQIIAHAREKNCQLRDGPFSKQFASAQMMALFRCENQKHDLSEIEILFEENQISYIPLKGAIVRSYYPEDWMRTSCDIDILVHEKDLKRSIELLTDKLGYHRDAHQNYHDVSLYSPSGSHIELHFSIKENLEFVDGLLERVWFHAAPLHDSFCYKQSDEFMIFHHLAHMTYHFLNGGCGIKPFLDLWIMQKRMQYDESLVRKYCRECSVERFYDNVLHLIRIWFEGESHTPLSKDMETFLLSGGVYGTLENKVLIAQGRSGNKFRYFFSRVFIPCNTLSNYYPILKDHPFLYPFFLCVRWWRIAFSKKDFNNGVRELKINQKICRAQSREIDTFLKKVGL